MGVRVEIFAIGNELCYGRVYDTNSFWIAAQTTRLGAKVQRITCVPDVVKEICTALRAALNRKTDFIIITGGLGPTSDDLTIESLSKLLGVEIEIKDKIYEALAEREGVTKDDLPVIAKMARSLKDTSCFPNPDGWAPVTLVERGETTLVALPGPPEEMKACFTEYLGKRISEKTQYRSVSKRILLKMYEDQASLLTKQVMKKIPGTYLKPLVGDYDPDRGLPVDILVFGKDEKTCRLGMKKTVRKLRELVNEGHPQ